MPKDELTITVNCPEDAEAVIPFNLTATPAVGQGRGTLTSQPTLQTFLVTNEGTINYPVLRHIESGRMTVNQVEDLIASKIEGTYLKTRPVVTVRLSNYKISVLGEVTSRVLTPCLPRRFRFTGLWLGQGHDRLRTSRQCETHP